MQLISDFLISIAPLIDEEDDDGVVREVIEVDYDDWKEDRAGIKMTRGEMESQVKWVLGGVENMKDYLAVKIAKRKDRKYVLVANDFPEI